MSSFIKLDRKVKHWGWYDEPNMLALWVHILMNANYHPNEWHGVEYEEGTFPTSVEKLSVESGLSVQTVRTCLKKLQLTNEITIQTTNKGTKIIVNKWNEYQGCESENNKQANEPTNKQANNQANNTKRNTRNKRTLRKKEYIEKDFIPPTLEEIEQYCKDRNNGVNPKKFFDYYAPNWLDSQGNHVRNWKQKMIAVWEKDVETPRVDNTLPTYDSSRNTVLTDEEEKEIFELMGRA